MAQDDGVYDSRLGQVLYSAGTLNITANGAQVEAMIAPIVGGQGVKWQFGDVQTIAYSLVTTSSIFDPDEYDNTFLGLPRDQFDDFNEHIVDFWGIETTNITDVASAWQRVTNVVFDLKDEAAGEVGDIRIGLTSSAEFDPQAAGLTAPIDGTDNAQVGDVWFRSSVRGFSQYSSSYFALLHEFGHAVFGFQDVTGSPGLEGSRLDLAWDRPQWTIMSYNFANSAEQGYVDFAYGVFPTTPMYLDIIAAEAIYGRKHNSGDDAYTANARGLATIHDDGGDDTLTWDDSGDPFGIPVAGFINLGTYAAGQNVSPLANTGWSGRLDDNGFNIVDWRVFLTPGTLIERAIGGGGGDYIIGNGVANAVDGGRGNDTIAGGAGNDTLDGGDGYDTAVFANRADYYIITRVGDKVTVASKFLVMTDGTDTLLNVEQLRFSDKTIDVADLPDLSAGTAAGGDASDGGIGGTGGGVGGNDGSGGTAPPAGATITGHDYAEHIRGTSAGETISGLGGDDTLTGYAGQDTFDGGAGSDTVDYSYQPADVSGTISLGSGNGTADFAGYYTETLTSIENVWMGAGNDTVVGDAGANDLRGGPGDDTLEGGLGNDNIYGDWKYSDQSDSDTAILSYTFGSGYTVSGSATALHIVGAEGDDWYYNVENFQFADGVTTTAAELAATLFPSYSIAEIPVPAASSHGNQQRDSEVASLSDDGRFIAFMSAASNLIGVDDNNIWDVFVYDRVAGTVECVSRTAAGTTGNGFSGGPSISGDGRFVAFESTASDLVSGDTNEQEDIFVYDRLLGLMEKITPSSDGNGAQQFSQTPAISADGRFVAYVSERNDIVSDDTNGLPDVFVYDRQSGVTERVSIAADGTEANGTSWIGSRGDVSISSDGHYVAFTSTATNLTPDGQGGVFVYDRDLHNIQLIGAGGAHPSLSGDGRYVAYEHMIGWASFEIVVVDRSDNSIVTIQLPNMAGAGGAPEISSNGRYVTFHTTSAGLVPDDNNGANDIFVYDILTQTIERLSTASDRAQANASSYSPAISGDGSVVAFSSYASNLTADDLSGQDIFFTVLTPAPSNASPILQDDLVFATDNIATTGNLLADNGSGPDGDPDSDLLTVVGVSGGPGGGPDGGPQMMPTVGSASAALVDPATVGQIVLLASGATVIVNADGRFAYDSNGAFDSLGVGETAIDSFSYTISDGQGHTATATATVTITGTLQGLLITNGSGSLTGTAADDQITCGASNDTVRGGDGIDWLQGGDGADRLYGDNGNDWLDGGTGADRLYGGLGDDTYVRDNAGDVIVESAGAGLDTVLASVSTTLSANVESLTLTGASTINAAGNDLSNTIIGNDADNTINGRSGADTMNGGLGDDRYYVDNAGDVVTESADGGTDTVYASADWTLQTGSQVEYLRAASGVGGLALTGNELANRIYGGAGNDVIDGGADADRMYGGAGDDTYFRDNTGDVISEAANAGIDTVLASVSTTLSGYVENLTLTGANVINGTGNTLDNIMAGNSAYNVLNGRDGNDTLIGGGGADRLAGGAGADVFRFLAATDSGPTAGTIDSILDFHSSEGDRIDLSSVFAGSLSYLGGAAFTGSAGEVRLVTAASGQYVRLDLDGDKLTDMSIFLKAGGITAEGDFIL